MEPTPEVDVETLGLALQLGGIAIMAAGYLWALVYCFRQGIMLGLLCFFLGLLVLIYLLVRGERGAIAPAITCYGGFFLFLAGGGITKG